MATNWSSQPFQNRQIWVVYCSPIANGSVRLQSHTMTRGLLHPMVWGTSVNSLALILKTIYLFLPCKLIFWKATKVGSPPNFPKLMSQLWGIPQPQYFVTSLLEPYQTYFWKHYIYHKEDTIVGSQNLATKFGFVPDCWGNHGLTLSRWQAISWINDEQVLFSAANLALAGFPLTNALGESMPSRL